MTAVLVHRLGQLGAAAPGCGAKASTLDALVVDGWPVPSGLCVTPHALRDTVAAAGLEERWRAALDRKVNAAAVIRGLIDQLDLSELVGQIVALADPTWALVAVRSSSNVEDGAASSHAGEFCSKLHVPIEPDPLAAAVKEVWASAFSPLRIASGDPLTLLDMAVIVQHQVHADTAGVCFTSDPISGRPGLIVEATRGTAEALLEGAVAATARYEQLADGWTGHGEGLLSDDDLGRLAELGADLEAQWRTPVDFEWARDRSGIHLLQVRPMTGLRPTQPPIVDVVYLDIDDTAAVSAVVSGGMRDFVSHDAVKHHFVRREARRRRLDHPTRGVLTVPGTLFDEALTAATAQELREALAGLQTPVVELIDPDGVMSRVRLADLPARLAALPPRPEGYAVGVDECFVGEISGLCSVLTDGNVLIEYVPGAAGGLRYGDVRPSRLVVTTDGTVVDAALARNTQRWALDEGTLDIGPVAQPDAELHLSGEIIAEVVRIAVETADAFGRPSVEWLHASGRTFLWDLSLEDHDLVASGGTMSLGYARGPVVVLEDLAGEDDLAAERSVLVDEAFTAAHASAAAVQLREAANRFGAPPIIVVAHPRTSLAIYLGSVAGFVFDSGALLCHLAIILREAGIPAGIVPDATRTLREGQIVEIFDGTVRVVEP